MKRLSFKRRRVRLLLLGLVVVSFVAAYALWSPGKDVRDGRHDFGKNGIWMEHGWLGDDAWFARNGKDARKGEYRDVVRLAEKARKMKLGHMRYVYPHLCPAAVTGEIAPADEEQVERFLDAFGAEAIEVLPWVGGVRGGSARAEDVRWRRVFVESCRGLLERHPRLAGMHVNVEPMPSGDRDFLLLLEELRAALPAGKKLSVAAYPPPTVWQRVPEVHWEEAYSRAVAARVDQAVVMMYDTSLRNGKLYEKLMKDWTGEVLAWYGSTEVLLGVPAYEDAGVGYHDARVENLERALAGVHAGLMATAVPGNYGGVSIYCDWEMTEEKWRVWRERFLKE